MKKVIATIMLAVYILMCIPNVISAEQENLFNFNVVSNGKTRNANASISDAILYGQTSMASGISGNCIYFDGTNSYVELPQQNRVQGLNTFSITFWIKPKIDNSTEFMPVLHSENIFEIGIDNETRKLNVMLQTESAIELTSTYNLEGDKWQYIAVTYDGSKLCLYVNGKQDNCNTASGNIKSSDVPTYLGTDGTSYYKGSIDEVDFYKSALSENEIGDLYHKYMDVITDWNYVSYPLKSSYQHGVSAASSELFKNSKIDKPISTGFEERNEINAINSESKDGQLEIVEDKYTGRFALKINKKTEDILPIQETEYFKTVEEDLASTSSLIRSDSGINISVNENIMTVSGTKYPDEMIALLVKNGEEITHLDQTTADSGGYFEFNFPVDYYGDYTVRVGGSQTGSYATSFYFADPNSKKPDVVKTEEVQVKCNSYNLMIKPMFKSETISFYVKSYVQDENGNEKEQYVLIKSDSDGDGIFKVGEDLSRGKWQRIELNLLDTDIVFQSEAVAGLYVDANSYSEWIFDDIDSEYKKINQSNIPLSHFEKENIIYMESGLQFSKSSDSIVFDNNEGVVTGGIDVSQKISEISVDSGSVYVNSDNTSESWEEKRKVLLNEPISSASWSVDDTDYDTSETAVGQKVEKIYHRETVPSAANYYTSMRVEIGENERLFRLKLTQGATKGKVITITDKNGTEKVYNLSSTALFTEWYDDDVTITSSSSSYYLKNILGIIEVEYYKKDISTEQNIILKNQGKAVLDVGNFETTDRTRLTIEAFKMDISSSGTIMVCLKDKDGNTYYRKRFVNTLTNDALEMQDIIPKIKKGTKIEITNQFTETNGNQADEVIISNLKVENIVKSDWNIEDEKKYSITSKTYFYNTIGQDTTQPAFEGTWVSEIAGEENAYATTFPNIGGIVNRTSTQQTLPLDSTHSVILRIVNLGTSDSCIEDSYGNITRLNYGECDYLINTSYNIVIPADPNIVIVSATYISGTYTNLNNLTYNSVEGLSGAYDVSSDGSKIFFANINDKNTLYSYDFNSKKYTKIYDAAIKEIVISPDETMAVIRKANNNYYLLKISTLEETELPCTGVKHSFVFSPQNELFAVIKLDNASERPYTLNVYSGNAFVNFFTEGDYSSFRGTVEFNFDKTGNYVYIPTVGALYKKTNGIWNKVKELSLYSGILSNDATTIFTNKIFDLNTNTTEDYPEGFTFVDKTNDDLLLLKKTGSSTGMCYYYLYNPITGENNRILEYQVSEFTNPKFYSEQNVFMVFMPGGMVMRRYFTTEKPEVKYALSFDGKDNWYTYTGGRWKLLSKSNTPTIKEMQSSGMTNEEVNNIPAAAYDKLYEDGNDVLTVDIAIYMNSPFNNQSPAIKQITVSTRDEADLNGLYGVHIEKYEKSEYRTVSSIFPIENFASNAECYYLLYIGNDWLYTYKDNKLVKTVESADELLSNIDTSWITFKQYGMTAKELRSVPTNVINTLFVNDNYANTEFGVIYVVKTDSDDTNGFTVNFRLKSESNFIAEDDVVIEIVMGSGDKIVVDSNEFSKSEIENLLSWIEARQNGSGDIFYRIRNGQKQYFINYYMINSINVYSGAEYRESHSQTNGE